MCALLFIFLIAVKKQVSLYNYNNNTDSYLLTYLSSLSVVNWDTVWRANTTAKFRVNTQMNRNVGLLRLFPGITADTVRRHSAGWAEGMGVLMSHNHVFLMTLTG